MSDTSNYPYAIDGYQQIPLLVEKVSLVKADNLNRLRSATINLENTLGIAPHYSDTYGEFENVDARLENSEAILDSVDLQYVTDRGNETTHSLEVQNGTAALPAYTFYQDVNTGMFRPDSDELGFSTLGAEQLRIDASGQVGIGKINPSYLLDVAGDVNIDGDLEVLGDIHAVGNITFDAGTGGRIILGSGPEDEVDFNADIISDIIPDQDNVFDLGSAAQQWQDLNVYGVRSSSVLAINATGALDMDAASATLDTTGDISIISSAGPLSLEGTLVSVDSSVGTVVITANTDLDLVAGNTVDIDGQVIEIESTAGLVEITAFTDLELLATNDVYVDSTTGDVDITSTTGEINLNTAAGPVVLNAATDLDLDATNDVYIDAVKDVSISSTAGDVKVSAVVGDVGLDTAAGFVILNAAGNVGIDSKAPSHKLSVANGNIEVSDASVLGPESLDEIQFATHTKWNVVNDFDDTGGNAHYTLSAVGLTSSITQPQADLATPGVGKRWYAFTYDVLLTASFDSDGEVTIGPSFSSPPAKLDLTTGTHTVYFQSSAGPTDFSIIVTSTTDTTGEFTIDNVSLKEIQGGNAIVNGLVTGGGVSGIKILSNGNVGLGTIDPEHLLHVVGDARIQGDLTVNGTVTQIDTDVATTERLEITNDGTGPAIIVNQQGAQPIADFQDDGATALYIEDGGNVGLGLNNPDKKLHIFDSYAATGTNETSIVIERRVDGVAVGANGIGASIEFRLENDTNAPIASGLISTILTSVAAGTETSVMKFSTRRITDGLAERVIIDQDGRVGIGEFDPKSTLSVGGSVSFPIKSIAFGDSPYAVLEADYTILVDASGGNVEVDLPNAQNYEGRICNVKKIDASANAVSMIDLTPNDIDGALSKDISIQWVSVTIQSDGANWYII